MRSSTGAYYPRLDHVRALAAFLVFYWHSIHSAIPTNAVPSFFPMSIFEEGWTGVALFMTLSGYLFAKLVDGKDISYGFFLWNRLVRLAPLLIVVIAYYCIFEGYDWRKIPGGIIQPVWPGGAWTITVEFHFYLVFPAILLLHQRFGIGSLLAQF